MAIVNGGPLDDILDGGVGATNGPDELNGFGGDDILKGLGGADILNGGSGKDTAAYDASPVGVTADLVNGGVDGHADGDTYNSIENLIGSDHRDNLFGDSKDNGIEGGLGGDIIKGRAGDDQLGGGKGKDIIDGGKGKDQLDGGDSHDKLNGDKGKDKLKAGTGMDRLDGGKGNDNLTGGDHGDRFDFSTKLNSSNNVDKITDFNLNVDMIGLHKDIFKAVGNKLNNGEFRQGNAQDPNDFILYNPNNGKLSYDKDGNGNANKVLFAILKGSPNALDAADFTVYG